MVLKTKIQVILVIVDRLGTEKTLIRNSPRYIIYTFSASENMKVRFVLMQVIRPSLALAISSKACHNGNNNNNTELI